MERLKEFAKDVTMHGIFRIVESKKLAVKFFWLILFWGFMSHLIYQVFVTSRSYLNYHVISKIESRIERKLQFPAVTFCPTNSYSQNYTQENAMNETIMQEVIRNTNKGKSMIWSYYFGAKNYNYHMHFKNVLIPGIGLCYTFNSDGNLFQYNAGIYNGLNMVLFVSASDNNELPQWDPTNGKGVFISVHDPGEFSFPNFNGFGLAPGFSNFIALKKKTVIRQESPYVSNCTHRSKERLIFPGEYTLTSCVYSCQELAALRLCGLPYGPLTVTYLSIEQKQLLSRNVSSANKCLNDQETENYLLQVNCGCQIPCEENKYEKTLSSIKWPHDDMINKLRDYAPLQLNFSDTKLHNNFLKVSVFYEEISNDIITEIPQWTWISLFSEIGGTMGIWLGASFHIFSN